ncbi:MAG: preprotein translocase subunit SecG [Acidobacteriaceae bacterium]|jgi:preprotein translocase subunit SecG|nr:preprotein translocase subunit SecG [Acidobacteriaceae bacterium]
MPILFYFLTVIHVIVCLFLIVVVLLQSGKAADLAGAFGGMGSQTVFGPRGAATVLTKATTISAGVFLFTSLSLSVVATRSGGGGAKSVLETTKDPGAATQTGQPGATQVVPGAEPKVELFNEQGQKVGEQKLDLSKPNAPVEQKKK